MKSSAMKQLAIVSRRYPILGPVFWFLAIQYFIVQAVVTLAWTTPFSLKDNYISDLGNSTCGLYDGLYVCSPLHPIMNLSFIVFGITIALGAALIYTEFQRSLLSKIAFGLMFLSGIGSILVGVFPENTIGALHTLGAFLGLVIGNISIGLMAFSLSDVRKSFRVYSFLSASLSLTAFILFYNEIYLGIGRGGMERFISYPFTIWMILFGLYMIFVRLKARNSKITDKLN